MSTKQTVEQSRTRQSKGAILNESLVEQQLERGEKKKPNSPTKRQRNSLILTHLERTNLNLETRFIQFHTISCGIL